MRRMGAKRAWLYLAECWDANDKHFCWTEATVANRGCMGLCKSLRELLRYGLVSQTTYNKMYDTFVEARPRTANACYWWPTTPAGAKRRAACCRKLAEKS